MKIAPLSRVKRKPAVLVLPSYRRLTVLDASGQRDATGTRGVENLLRSVASSTCYVPAALTSLRLVSSATSWTCHTWRGRGTRMVHEPSGATFTSLRGALEGSGGAPADQWAALDEVLSWVGAYGVPPGSISGMAMGLFRASLSAPVTIGFDPVVARRAFFGGRQEATLRTDSKGRPKVYTHMAALDIKSAYANAMARVPYALSLRPVDPSTTLDPTVAGLAEASVDVPHGYPFGPLPRRLATDRIQFPTGGPVDGVWPWVELAAARELGCVVRVRSAWAPRATLDLFGPWYRLVASADRLGPGAQTLAKAIRNSLWGQFAMNGEENGITRWADDQGRIEITVDKEPRRMPHAWTTHIAAETAGRVRAQLLTEGLYGGGPGHPVHVDTDGIVVRQSHALSRPTGDGPGEWRLKATMKKVDLRGPQLYRWQCGDCAPSASMIGASRGKMHEPWHYLAAGVPRGRESEYFDRDTLVPVSHGSMFDVCIPGTHSLEHDLVKELMRV